MFGWHNGEMGEETFLILEHGHLASRTKVGVVDTGALIGHPACVSVRKRSAPKSFVLDRGWVASPVLVHPLWGSTYFALSQPGLSPASGMGPLDESSASGMGPVVRQ